MLILRVPQDERNAPGPEVSMLNQGRSRAIFAEAKRYLPGGVDSPVRSFRGVILV